jgi:hypothetical protein
MNKRGYICVSICSVQRDEGEYGFASTGNRDVLTVIFIVRAQSLIMNSPQSCSPVPAPAVCRDGGRPKRRPAGVPLWPEAGSGSLQQRYPGPAGGQDRFLQPGDGSGIAARKIKTSILKKSGFCTVIRGRLPQ